MIIVMLLLLMLLKRIKEQTRMQRTAVTVHDKNVASDRFFLCMSVEKAVSYQALHRF